MSESLPRDERVAQFLARIAGGGDFPAISQQLRDVMDVIRHEDTSMRMLANIVLKDYSLTLKILRTANSFQYNRSGRRVMSVTQAMVLLGVATVRDLATSLLLLEHYCQNAPGLKGLMALSMLTASHAAAAAQHTGYPRPEEAHLHGMFRNLGEVLVAHHAAADYSAVLAAARDRQVTITEACRAVLGFSFDELGAAACRGWNLTTAGSAGEGARSELDTLVAFGHDLTTAVYRQPHGDAEASLRVLLQRYAHDLSLNGEGLQGLLVTGHAETQAVFDSLGISSRDLRLRAQMESAVARLAPADEAGTPAVAAAAPEPPPGPSLAEVRADVLREIDETLAARDHFELNEVLLTVLEGLLSAGPFTRAAVCLLSEEPRELVGRFGLGEGVDQLVARLRFPLTIGPAGLAVGAAMLQRADLVCAAAGHARPDEKRLLALVGAQAACLLPLVVDRKTVGAIYADRVAGEAPDPATMTFAARLRDRAAAAMLAARRAREDAARRAALTPERKRDLVLRLIRGERIEALSRESAVPVEELETWRQHVMEAALRGLAS
jgi:hypothetical protein